MMNRSLNILMTLFTHRQEGTYYRAFPWAEYLVSQGHRVTLLCTSKEHRFRRVVSEENGVRIIEMPSLFSGRYVMTRLCGLYGWGPLDIAGRWREIRRGHYDVVHAFEHQLHVSLPVFIAGRKCVPVLVADWCDHYGKGGFREVEYSPYRLAPLYRVLGVPFRMLMDYLEGAFRRRADAVTVISTFLRERALQKGVPAEKIHLITGSADVQNIQVQSKAEARRRLGLADASPVALFFGAGQFDVGFSLEAFARARQVCPDLCFVVVGKKDSAVSRKADELGVRDGLIQTGWIEDGALGDWLACADVCLLPMKDNPPNQARWPNKIGFYMAAGRPVVTTGVNDVGALVERSETGLVSAVDVQDFSDKMVHLITHSELAEAMGRRARDLAEKELALPIHGARLEQLYATLMEIHDDA
jgi:glycosyltransferase involved in cell wall biosynthesis